jgi:hypothetical protein
MEVVQLFQNFRSELLSVVSNSDLPISEATLSTKRSQTKKESKSSLIQRIPPRVFHIETKEKVKKALEKLTEDCPVKIRLDGDKDLLVKRYTEFVHLNNAQLSAKDPLSLSEIVHEIHRRERALEMNSKISKKVMLMVEGIKSGQESKEVKAGFSELVKVSNSIYH